MTVNHLEENISKNSVQCITNCAIYVKKHHFAAVSKNSNKVSQHINNVQKVNGINISEINCLYLDNVLIDVDTVKSTEK